MTRHLKKTKRGIRGQKNLSAERTSQESSGMMMAWPTPILKKHWPEDREIAARLKEIILKREAGDPGINKAQIGGWHSEPDLLQWQAPEVAHVGNRIQLALLEYLSILNKGAKPAGDVRIAAWANVSRPGDFHGVHSHPNHVLSGVYYIATGKPDPDQPHQGEIHFIDPRLGVEMSPLPGSHFGQKVTIPPEIGTMLIFPSWLQHLVHPFQGSGERISISFNIRFRNLEIGDKA